jgi:hypothetical protein
MSLCHRFLIKATESISAVSSILPPLTDQGTETLHLNKPESLDMSRSDMFIATPLSIIFRLKSILLGSCDLIYCNFVLLACGTLHIYAEKCIVEIQVYSDRGFHQS